MSIATALLVILGPILMPIVLQVGIDPIHFGVFMVMSLQTAVFNPHFYSDNGFAFPNNNVMVAEFAG